MADIAGPYSSLKILHHPERIAQLRRGEQIVPTHLQLVISDLCSQSCHFCSYRWDGNISNQLFHIIDPTTGEKNHNPKRFIPYEKCCEIMDDMAEMGIKACQITGGGEPTVHSDHHDIFKYGLSKGLEMSLVTHGVLLKPDVIETLTGFAWVRVSVDAGSPQSYAAIRRVGEYQYHRALANIKLLCERRDATNSKLLVGFGFVVTKENWREVVDACKTAKSLGVDSFRISAVFQPDGDAYFKDFFEEASIACRHCESLSEGRFQVANSFGNRLSDLKQGHPDYKPCLYQQFTTYVGATLQVFRCCNTAYNERGLIGSIANQRFKDLWESEQKRQDFDEFDARGCERCQFNAMNRALAYAVNHEAPHINFV